VNLGRDLHLSSAPEPLLAPPDGCRWETHWSTEDVRYGGCGTPPLDVDGGWQVPGEAAVVLVPQRLPQPYAQQSSVGLIHQPEARARA
jgi:maltooligosyltrehalose trehalohydrolase